MKKLKLLTVMSAVVPLVATGAAVAHTAHASAGPTIVTTKHTSLGTILVTSSGQTLYADTGAACTGGCLQIWPPLTASGKLEAKGKAKKADLGRTGGQVTYNGHALYTFTSDSSSNPTSGQGSNGFYVVSPSGNVIKHAPKSSGGSSSSSGW